MKVVLILIYLFGLVAIARVKHPVPSRTRPLSTEALMVLHLKVWESKSPPNLINNIYVSLYDDKTLMTRDGAAR